MAALHEVADILNARWTWVQQSEKFNTWQMRTLDAVRRCRTASLGAHVDGCTHCGHLRISYNSCRNRHCPKCQGEQRERWIHEREQELLPVPYFHMVFTLPDMLNQLCLHQGKAVYSLLFQTAWCVLRCFGQDAKWLGANMGMIAVLHTWGQAMGLHPHLHCLVPGGGLTSQGKWKTARSKGKYLFPVKAMSKVFRTRFIVALKKVLPAEMTTDLVKQLYKVNWVIYAKRPFDGPENVIKYLGRYTHKIAISNHRILHVSDETVTFSYKDYRQGGVTKEMTLGASEFIRRFSIHILPKGFVRIRHYGILSGASKVKCASQIKEQLPDPLKYKLNTPLSQIYNPRQCPCCNQETMQTILHFNHRGPPKDWEIIAKRILSYVS